MMTPSKCGALCDTHGHTPMKLVLLSMLDSFHLSACLLSHFSCAWLCDPKDCSLPSPCPWGFSRQEYWSGLPRPPPGDLPDPGTQPVSFMSPALAGGLFTTSAIWEAHYLCAAAKSLQSCLTLCNPIDGSPPGSPIPGILQARTLEWVAISFSNAWKWNRSVMSNS